MDKRFKQINSLLGEYATGGFERRLPLSPRLDEIDAMISGINMLGEELRAITISRDYFNSIFNAVSDMVFILNRQGLIMDNNVPAEKQLNFAPGSLRGLAIYTLLRRKAAYLKELVARAGKRPVAVKDKALLYNHAGAPVPVEITLCAFRAGHRAKPLILLTASDITFKQQTENLIIRAIIDTQEKERCRLARDLHDSIIQQVSAIKFYVSSATGVASQQIVRSVLRKSGEALTGVMADIRTLCFNLMPRTLEEFGLVKAVQEYCNQFMYYKMAVFMVRKEGELPVLPAVLSIDLYRVVQEFISNAIRHGKAGEIDILFRYDGTNLELVLADNGSGFDTGAGTSGMGLQNVHSRIKSHGGVLELASSVGKGTVYNIKIPLSAD